MCRSAVLVLDRPSDASPVLLPKIDSSSLVPWEFQVAIWRFSYWCLNVFLLGLDGSLGWSFSHLVTHFMCGCARVGGWEGLIFPVCSACISLCCLLCYRNKVDGLADLKHKNTVCPCSSFLKLFLLAPFCCSEFPCYSCSLIILIISCEISYIHTCIHYVSHIFIYIFSGQLNHPNVP